MIELVGDTPEGETLAHLTRCGACRKEYVQLRAALVDVAAHAHAQAERSDAFFQAQHARIARRLGERRPIIRRWRGAWAPALAAAALLAVFLTRGGPPFQRPRDSEADRALLSAVERSIHVDAPAALRPAVLLVSEVERDVVQTHRGGTAPQGNHP